MEEENKQRKVIKISQEDIVQIKKMKSQGWSDKDIAKLYKVSSPTIKYHTNDEYKAYLNSRHNKSTKGGDMNAYGIISSFRTKVSKLVEDVAKLKKAKHRLSLSLENTSKELDKKQKSLQQILNKLK